MVLALYEKPKAYILVNSSTPSSLHLYQGTRQGCPFSSLLYLLSVDPLLKILNAGMNIICLQFHQRSFKTAAYADDTLIFSEDIEAAIPSVINIINTFSKVSGYMLNKDKTEVFHLNPL